MPVVTSVILNTGATIPTVGLGTWKSEPGQVEHAVEFALRNGYRHVDTAAAYQNETEVGRGIKASGVPREQIFLTTKLDNPDQRNPVAALESSLKKLDTHYIDLWLMHWPAPMTKDEQADREHDRLGTWKVMEDLYLAYPKKMKAIDFSVERLEQLLRAARVLPAVNQIELHPSCPQHDVVEYRQKKGIVLAAYSPLGSDNSLPLKDEVVNRIATKYGVPPANVLISLHANKPLHTMLPKSVANERILSNAKIVDLAEEDINDLHRIDKHTTSVPATPIGLVLAASGSLTAGKGDPGVSKWYKQVC